MLYEMDGANQSQRCIMDFCGSWVVFSPSTKPSSSLGFNLSLFVFPYQVIDRKRQAQSVFVLINTVPCTLISSSQRLQRLNNPTRNKEEGEKGVLFCEDIWVCEVWRKKPWAWSQSPGTSCKPPAGLPEAGVFLPEIILGATLPCYPSYQSNIFESAFLL